MVYGSQGLPHYIRNDRQYGLYVGFPIFNFQPIRGEMGDFSCFQYLPHFPCIWDAVSTAVSVTINADSAPVNGDITTSNVV
jgi:hypothetical protein